MPEADPVLQPYPALKPGEHQTIIERIIKRSRPIKKVKKPPQDPYDPTLKAGLYKTFFKLVHLANQPDGCTFSDPHVAEKIGISAETYRIHRKELQRIGFINAEKVPYLWTYRITIPLIIRNKIKGKKMRDYSIGENPKASIGELHRYSISRENIKGVYKKKEKGEIPIWQQPKTTATPKTRKQTRQFLIKKGILKP